MKYTGRKIPKGWKVENPLFSRLQASGQRLGNAKVKEQIKGMQHASRGEISRAITTVEGILSGEIHVHPDKIRL